MAGFAGVETLVLIIIFSGIFNISPADINSFVLNSYVSAFSFLLIVHALMFALGRVGQFASIVFMILQLASSGGMFPIATTPQIFQNMAPFMPLYYSLTAFRQAILGGLSQPIFESSIFSLIVFGLIFGAISLLAYYIKINSSENKTLSSNKI
jgi:predicted phage infection protein